MKLVTFNASVDEEKAVRVDQTAEGYTVSFAGASINIDVQLFSRCTHGQHDSTCSSRGSVSCDTVNRTNRTAARQWLSKEYASEKKARIA